MEEYINRLLAFEPKEPFNQKEIKHYSQIIVTTPKLVKEFKKFIKTKTN